ncbi:MAG: hypothetical protein WB696_07955, partial [Chthoniobacterales bacterium]
FGHPILSRSVIQHTVLIAVLRYRHDQFSERRLEFVVASDEQLPVAATSLSDIVSMFTGVALFREDDVGSP